MSGVEQAAAAEHPVGALDAAALSGLISPLRRSLLRAAREAQHLPEIPDAQIEVLRAWPSDVSRSPVELADELSLNRTTVSNLLKSMEASGLITRETDAADRRRVGVRASERAHDLLRRFDAASASIVADALGELSSADAAALHAALPVLERLRDTLQSRTRSARGIRSTTFPVGNHE